MLESESLSQDKLKLKFLSIVKCVIALCGFLIITSVNAQQTTQTGASNSTTQNSIDSLNRTIIQARVEKSEIRQTLSMIEIELDSINSQRQVIRKRVKLDSNPDQEVLRVRYAQLLELEQRKTDMQIILGTYHTLSRMNRWQVALNHGNLSMLARTNFYYRHWLNFQTKAIDNLEKKLQGFSESENAIIAEEAILAESFKKLAKKRDKLLANKKLLLERQPILDQLIQTNQDRIQRLQSQRPNEFLPPR